jgi:hypothetical protein
VVTAAFEYQGGEGVMTARKAMTMIERYGEHGRPPKGFPAPSQKNIAKI